MSLLSLAGLISHYYKLTAMQFFTSAAPRKMWRRRPLILAGLAAR